MREPYAEGLANYSGYESCADNRKVVREAFDNSVHRLSIEPRKTLHQSADTVLVVGRQHC